MVAFGFGSENICAAAVHLIKTTMLNFSYHTFVNTIAFLICESIGFTSSTMVGGSSLFVIHQV